MNRRIINLGKENLSNYHILGNYANGQRIPHATQITCWPPSNNSKEAKNKQSTQDTPCWSKDNNKKNARIIRRKSLSKVNRNNRKTKVSIQTLKRKMGHKQLGVKGGKTEILGLRGDFGRHMGM